MSQGHRHNPKSGHSQLLVGPSSTRATTTTQCECAHQHGVKMQARKLILLHESCERQTEQPTSLGTQDHPTRGGRNQDQAQPSPEWVSQEFAALVRCLFA